MRRLALLNVVLPVAATACADPSALTRPDPSGLDAASFARPVLPSPVIDGVIRTGEYDGAAAVTFDAALPDGRRTPVTVQFTHDRQYLYAVATVPRITSIHGSDAVFLEFDNDNDGVREDGDDIIGKNAESTPHVPGIGADYYRFNNGTENQVDVATGGSIDVTAAWGASTTNVATFELRHDLDSADDRHDFSIDPSRRAQTVGVQISVRFEAEPVESGVFTNTVYPSSSSYCRLTISKKSTSMVCP